MKKNLLKKSIPVFALIFYFYVFALFAFNFIVFPSTLSAGEAAAVAVTVNVRHEDTLLWSGPVSLVKNSTSTISDNSGINRTIPSDSALAFLTAADDLSLDFSLSDLVYYADFDSLYVNCIDIVSPPKHACANWQYVVNSNYPPVGMDKYILSDSDILYLYFGNPRRVLLSSASAETAAPVKVKAESYDYVNNAWTVLSGAILGATQTNPDDLYSPLVIFSATSDENGLAQIILGAPGVYNIGLAMDYYFPAEILTVMAPSQIIVNEPAAENVQPQEAPEPARSRSSARRSSAGAVGGTGEFAATANEAEGTGEIIVKMDISMDDFMERYDIALQNQKSMARGEAKNKIINKSLAVYNDKNPGESQVAGASAALKPRETWMKKVFSKISYFFGFKNKSR